VVSVELKGDLPREGSLRVATFVESTYSARMVECIETTKLLINGK
jgi:hypothetical protein